MWLAPIAQLNTNVKRVQKMHYIRQLLWSSCLSLGLIASSMAEESMMIDKFDAQPELRWKYFSDQVMDSLHHSSTGF